jgi:hypothetical protein
MPLGHLSEKLEKNLDKLAISMAILLASPALMMDYLPFADLPQHVAITSILAHFSNPEYAFSDFYEITPWRTLYWFTYAIAVPLTLILSAKTAFSVVVFLSLLLYPLGLRALLKAFNRPAYLMVFGLPFVYSRATYWGFINFNLALGFALLAWAWFLSDQPKKTRLILVCTLCGVMSHIYFVGVIGLLALIYFVQYRQKSTLLRLIPFLPAILVSGLWMIVFSQAHGDARTQDISLYGKLLSIPMELNGGFSDASDNILGCATVVILCLLAAWGFATRPNEDERARKIFWATVIFVLVNILLYFALPLHTSTAKFVNFRHLILAAAFMPLVIKPHVARRNIVAVGGFILGLFTCANILFHLMQFSSESSDFKALEEKVTPGSTVAALVFEHGSVIRTYPYLHFHAYIQASRGGFISGSFAKFWNIPIGIRSDRNIPDQYQDLEWQPKTFDENLHPGFTDFVVARTKEGVTFPETDYFPFRLQASEGAWQLYKRTTSTDTGPKIPQPTK